MCGGIKQTFRGADKVTIFQTGQPCEYLDKEGIHQAIYGGSVRSETIEQKWKGYIQKEVTIQAQQFFERDTIHRTYELKPFEVPPGKGIQALITNGNVLRIITKPAEGETSKVHSREPVLADI